MSNIQSVTSIESRAIELLGAGNSPAQVALALGVTEGRVSQIVSDPNNSQRIAELKYQNLAKHNARDAKFDKIEDALADKLEESLPLMIRPMEILRGLQLVNSLKRRGQSAPEAVINQATVVSVVMPVQVVNKFTTAGNNQVIEAGEQTLITMQSHNLRKLAGDRKAVQNGDSEQKRITVNSRVTADTINNL